MRKKIFLLAGIAAFAAAVAFNVSLGSRGESMSDLALANIEALATSEINPDCPNGCVDGGGGCYCKQSYPQYKEASW